MDSNSWRGGESNAGESYTFRPENERSASERVVDAVATVENVPATELDPQLYESIDPDALDAIFADNRTAQSDKTYVKFGFAGHRVHIRANGTITID